MIRCILFVCLVGVTCVAVALVATFNVVVLGGCVRVVLLWGGVCYVWWSGFGLVCC